LRFFQKFGVQTKHFVDTLFSVQCLAVANKGTLFLNERTGGEVEEGDRGWRWYLCNPGTASWEMVREACIPGHVLSQARLTYTCPTTDSSNSPHRPRTQPPISHLPFHMRDICDTIEARSRKILLLKLTIFTYERITGFNFTASRALWKKCRFYILGILIPPKIIYMLETTSCRIFINKWKILKLFNDFDNKFLWGSNITQIFYVNESFYYYI